jgi:hypothetical protein
VCRVATRASENLKRAPNNAKAALAHQQRRRRAA